jgi:hypothetical protein
MNPLDELIRKSAPKFPEPKNLRLLLDLGLITRDTKAETAFWAWFHLACDPIVAEREAADPSPQRYRVIGGVLKRRTVRDEVVRKVIAEMAEEERAALRARLLARRVTQIPSPNEPLTI